MNKFILAILLISFNTYSKSEYNIVVQPYLESKLSCDDIKNKINLCFIEAKEHYDFKSFIFTFKLELKIKENELEKTLQAVADQISLTLNPLTAEFYKEKSLLTTNLKSKKFKPEDVIVELKVKNNNKNYTAYMYPKKNKNGNISLISKFFTGKHDVFEKLKFNCKLVKSTPLSDEESIDDACKPYNSNINNKNEEKMNRLKISILLILIPILSKMALADCSEISCNGIGEQVVKSVYVTNKPAGVAYLQAQIGKEKLKCNLVEGNLMT